MNQRGCVKLEPGMLMNVNRELLLYRDPTHLRAPEYHPAGLMHNFTHVASFSGVALIVAVMHDDCAFILLNDKYGWSKGGLKGLEVIPC